jgi:hypothetical protein
LSDVGRLSSIYRGLTLGRQVGDVVHQALGRGGDGGQAPLRAPGPVAAQITGVAPAGLGGDALGHQLGAGGLQDLDEHPARALARRGRSREQWNGK